MTIFYIQKDVYGNISKINKVCGHNKNKAKVGTRSGWGCSQ